jgi:hypothetical protein
MEKSATKQKQENRKMTNAVAEANDKNPFEQYGESATQRSIVGTLLKFNKGDYLAGQNNEEIPTGTKMVVNMDSFTVGWIKWEDSKPTSQKMGLVIEGFQPPSREDLGDNDKTLWEVDTRTGKPRDPWQFSNYLVLANADTKELYTFATSSRGGLSTTGELSKVYGKEMRQRPNEWPIIELNKNSYNHPDKTIGIVKTPLFKIVGWIAKTETQQLAIAASEKAVTDEGEAPFVLDGDALSSNGKTSKKTKF